MRISALFIPLALSICLTSIIQKALAADAVGAGHTQAPAAVAPQPKAPTVSPVNVNNSSNASQSVKPRIEHSVNRYAHGNQTMTGSRLQHNPIIMHHAFAMPQHAGHHEVHHIVLAGKSDRAQRVAAHTTKTSVHGNLTPRHMQRHHRDVGGSGGDNGGGGGGSYDGANGDSGGGGESVGAISTSGVNIPIATAQQARTFWNAVHPDFNRWNITHDGRLTQAEITHALRDPSIKGNKAAALSALLVTMKDKPEKASRNARYWSLDGLEKLVHAAEQTNKSRLISRFAQHTQALSEQEKQPDKMPLFGNTGTPSLGDLVKGPTDNHAFLAAAAGLAHLRPEALRAMIQSDGHGTFTVHFPNTAPQAVRLSQGEVAELTSNGRNVLWLDILRKAHERLADAEAIEGAGHEGKHSELEFLSLIDKADVSQVMPLLTHHESETIDLLAQSESAIKADLIPPLAQKRLALLSNGLRTAVVLDLDSQKDLVEVWQPQSAAPTGGSTDKLTAAAEKPKTTEWLSLADLSKQFTTLYVESEKHTARTYSQILSAGGSGINSSALASSETAEDESVSELIEQGVAVAENANGQSVRTTDVTLKNGRKLIEFDIDEGSALVAHEDHVRVKTRICDVQVAPNAAAYILAMDGATAIFNLSDMRSGEVLVKFGNGKRIRVPLGQQILLVKDLKADFESANPDNLILHRNVVSLGKMGDVAVFRAEFSFTSLLDNATGFQELCNSEKSSDQKIVKRLIKTAAIMLTLRPPFDEPAAAPIDKMPTAGNDQEQTHKAAAR